MTRRCRTRKFSFTEAAMLMKTVHIPFGIPVREFQSGLNVELEHRDITCGDPLLTARIAAAHFRERKDYYVRLRRYVER